MEKKKILKFIFIFSILISSFCVFGKVNAASLYLSPSSGSHLIGQTFSVNIYVSSSDQSMNAASGVISFPSDKLEIASLSKTSSIFSLWVQEPTFSNSAGIITFEGIVLNPGFIGSSGKIITVNFKSKTAGSATLTFSSGSVLANDGQGTNILTSMGTAVFSIGVTGPAVPSVTTPAETVGVPLAPIITSFTHPDSEKWYSNNIPEFSWELPSDVTAVKLLIGRLPVATPTVLYSSPISEKKIDEEMPDGTYYFHAQFKNNYGWGAISHRKVLVDTQPPRLFTIKFSDGRETDNPRPTILFNTTDLMSGVDYYKVKVGNGDFFITTQSVLHNPHTLPLQYPGKHTLVVQAYDKASNYTTASEEFIILAIESPKITGYPTKLTKGDILVIKGETYPNATITVWLQKEGAEAFAQNVASNEEGKFEFIARETLGRGVYRMWAEVIDSRGAKSYPTDEYVVAVTSRFLDTAVSFLTSYLSLIILLIITIFALLSLVWFGWYKFLTLKRKLRKEVKEAEESLYKAFNLLKEDVREQIKLLEKTKTKRQLTEEEDKVKKRLRKNLDNAEKFIRKEIKDIKKEIE